MRFLRLVARGFRNLADMDRELPEPGLALLGANGQGKTNLLEALYYPVLFRSFRGAADAEIAQFGGSGFHVEVAVEHSPGPRLVAATWAGSARRKRIAVAGEEVTRIGDAVGTCVAVAFLPTDVGLAAGPASERRRYLDRMLALAHRPYLRALTRYRAALAQRNSALRRGRAELARAFDRPLAESGAAVMRSRLEWAAGAASRFAAESAGLGEHAEPRLSYRGREELADAAGWPEALADAMARDCARGMTTVGPHRDDIVLELDGRGVRAVGSTGQQRTAAVALKLLELETIRRARGTEPALLLDDVFAELDRGRQAALAARLAAPDRQVFVSAPRRDELPAELDLPVWNIAAGRVR